MTEISLKFTISTGKKGERNFSKTITGPKRNQNTTYRLLKRSQQ